MAFISERVIHFQVRQEEASLRRLSSAFVELFDTIDNGITRTSANSARFSGDINRLAGSANSAVGSFDSLTSSLLGIGAAVGGIYAIKEAFEATITAGINLNRTMENSNYAIAGVISSFSSNMDTLGNSLNAQDKYNLALELTPEFLEDIRLASLQTAASQGELTTIYQKSIGMAMQSGEAMGSSLAEVHKNTLEITKTMSNIGKTIGIPMEQMAFEIKSILSGEVTQDSDIAQMLGIDNKAIEKAKGEVNGLFNLLQDKLSGFKPMESIKTFDVALANLGATFQDIQKEATKPLFDDLKDGLIEFDSYLSANSKNWITSIQDFYNNSTSIFSSFSESINSNLNLIDFSTLESSLVSSGEFSDMFLKKVGENLASFAIVLTNSINTISFGVSSLPQVFDYIVYSIAGGLAGFVENLDKVELTLQEWVLKIQSFLNESLKFEIAGKEIKLFEFDTKDNIAKINELKGSIKELGTYQNLLADKKFTALENLDKNLQKLETTIIPLDNVDKIMNDYKNIKGLKKELETLNITPNFKNNANVNDIYKNLNENRETLVKKYANDTNALKKIDKDYAKEIEALNKKVITNSLGELALKARPKKVDDKAIKKAQSDAKKEADRLAKLEEQTYKKITGDYSKTVDSKDKQLSDWYKISKDEILSNIKTKKLQSEALLKLDESYKEKKFDLLDAEFAQEEKLNQKRAEAQKKHLNEVFKSQDDSIKDWQGYYEKIGDFETSWQLKKAELYNQNYDKLGAENFEKLATVEKEKYFDSVKNKAKEIETTFTRLNANLSNTFENGFFDVLENGFDNIDDLVKDLGKSILSTFNKDLSNAISGVIGGYNLGNELLKAGYIKQENGDYYNASVDNTVLAKDIASSISKPLSSAVSDIVSIAGGAFTGFNIGSSIGKAIDPQNKSYLKYGAGAAGAVAGGAIGMGGLAALTLNPLLLPLLGGIAALSFGFGGKRKVESGYKLTTDLEGYFDTEIGTIKDYELWKKKSFFKTKSSTKLTDMDLQENIEFANFVNPFQSILDNLDKNDLIIKSGTYTNKTLESAIIDSFLSSVTGEVDVSKIKSKYETIAKETDTTISQVIQETFASLVQADFAIKQHTLDMRGDATGSYLLEMDSVNTAIKGFTRDFATLGIDINGIDTSNLGALREAILNINPTPDTIRSFNALSTALMGAEKNVVSFVDSVANKVLNADDIKKAQDNNNLIIPKEIKIGAENTADYWFRLNSGLISNGEMVAELTSKFGMNTVEAAAWTEGIDNMNSSMIIGSVGFDNIVKSVGVSQSAIEAVNSAILNMATSGDYSAKAISDTQTSLMDALLTKKELSPEDIVQIVGKAPLKADELIDVEPTLKKAAELFNLEPVTIKSTSLFNVQIETIKIPVEKAPSFAIGGYTTPNENIDGKGGFRAILHPNEYVLNADQTSKHSNLVGLLEKERRGLINLPSFADGGATSTITTRSSLDTGTQRIENTTNNYISILPYSSQMSDVGEFSNYFPEVAGIIRETNINLLSKEDKEFIETYRKEAIESEGIGAFINILNKTLPTEIENNYGKTEGIKAQTYENMTPQQKELAQLNYGTNAFSGIPEDIYKAIKVGGKENKEVISNWIKGLSKEDYQGFLQNIINPTLQGMGSSYGDGRMAKKYAGDINALTDSLIEDAKDTQKLTYDFTRQKYDLKILNEFNDRLEDVNFKIEDFTLENMTKKINELNGTVASNEEEFNKNNEAIAYLTSAYLQAQESIKNVIGLVTNDYEKLAKNKDYFTNLEISNSSKFRQIGKEDFKFNLNLQDYDILKNQIESKDFKNWLNKQTPDKIKEINDNLAPIVENLKNTMTEKNNLFLGIKDFNYGLDKDSIYVGNKTYNKEDVKNQGKTYGSIRDIQEEFAKYSYKIYTANQDNLVKALSDNLMSENEIDKRFKLSDGVYNTNAMQEYIINQQKEYFGLLADGLYENTDALKNLNKSFKDYLSELLTSDLSPLKESEKAIKSNDNFDIAKNELMNLVKTGASMQDVSTKWAELESINKTSLGLNKDVMGADNYASLFTNRLSELYNLKDLVGIKDVGLTSANNIDFDTSIAKKREFRDVGFTLPTKNQTQNNSNNDNSKEFKEVIALLKEEIAILKGILSKEYRISGRDLSQVIAKEKAYA